MILEAAFLYVKPELTSKFEADFAKASQYISSIEGYLGHRLEKCLEVENKYLLLVDWNTLEDHTVGFRTSEAYLEWKKILHHYYEPFPVVEHFETVFENKK
ncbi:MAG: antibiotic biosynthesis monooxygenase [Flavobacterium nitrogenifigens]|uniref:Heme-degrading monooxygenase HmoA n=1 Tax=Flavobacterium nitrogenifigens TaxID=1617283 RepID=A0A521B7S3_9FLAO|nr:antibiotic biosynthesis monooxygenase [Flavobacterium nitrogenifigens]KAF2334517.1 antibiotic biosynthesis monooxygenase [Flavobacterium nitrogenifigens]MDQ8014851.1 antibiotic biosynthesis monooxygenase [Flavobacterium nitrogenifigens]SMO43144.1 Heme-degrading monooxygenase HmoA [Flavobacterium nitrogenifigens]